MKNKTYCLIRDNDGHWYVVPTNKQDDAYDYFGAVEEGDYIDEPEWLDAVGGHPSFVEFTEYEIK